MSVRGLLSETGDDVSVFWRIDEGRKRIDFGARMHVLLLHPDLRHDSDGGTLLDVARQQAGWWNRQREALTIEGRPAIIRFG